MSQKKLPRKALFHAARQLHRDTVDQAAEKFGVGRGHLYAVLDNDRESLTLTRKIDEYIESARPLMAKSIAA